MNSLLITGATGYIGAKLAEYYIHSGYEVRLLVRDPAGLTAELKNKCQIVIGDLCRPATLDNAVRGVNAVIHAAGKLGHWGTTLKQLHDVNVQGSMNLVRAAHEASVKRFIHLSAGGVTGPVGVEPADESYKPAPVTPYERTKWEGEVSVMEFAVKKDMSLLTVRPTFTYGPGDPHKLALFKAVKSGRYAFIGDGLSTVHPVYIDDLIAGIDLSLKSNLKQESIIIGGTEPITKRELAYGIADALKVRRPTMKIPAFAANVIARTFELSSTVFKFNPPLTRSRVLALARNWGYSISKARAELGFEPRVELADGLHRTVNWYREQGWL